MNHDLELSHTHFRQMKKHLANVEKAWGEKALLSVKEELQTLYEMSKEVEEVIKNQLYFNLEESSGEQTNGQENERRGAGETS